MHVMGNGVVCRFKDGHSGKCSVLHPGVYEEIRAERHAQDAEWGGPEHDDQHGQAEWILYICKHAKRSELVSIYDFRKQMIRVAALAVAAIQSHDRKNRRTKRAQS